MPLDNRTCFTVNLRDELRCRHCGAGPERRETYHRGFGYHHVVHKSDGGADVVENVVLLCGGCHRDHHDGRVVLRFDDRPVPERFDCRACAQSLDAETVVMNCGWYACHHCGARTHLFDHFGFVEEPDDGD